MSAQADVSDRTLYAVLAALGVAVWLLPWLLLGGREAWDHSSYFTVSIPLMSAAAAYAGFRAPIRTWRWPLALALAQFAAALVLGGFGNLLPLGLVVFAILAVPMVVTASLGASAARRFGRRAS